MQVEELEIVVERVQRMEKLMDEVLEDVRKIAESEWKCPEVVCDNVDIREKVKVLEEYLESGLWLSDYQCDERGELPTDLKRGVLSEDGLYNLLCDVAKEYEVKNDGSRNDK